jgi:HD-GYP domain-containing protein (c-di-GMP phosphodiesterase class II)
MSTKNYSTPTKKYKRLVSAVHSIYRLLTSTFELRDFMIRFTRLVAQIFGAQYSMVLLLDASKKYSVFRCQVSGKEKFISETKQRIKSALEKKIINTAQTVKKRRLLAVPIICEDIMGIIVLGWDRKAASTGNLDDELLLTITQQAIIGIKNLQLYEEQQKIVLGSIKSLVTLLDVRIPQEYTHSPYFSRLVVAIANEMRLDEKQTESLKYASMLHDAGKVDIPLAILTKTTKLTPRELSIIQRHPLRGAEILRPLQVLRPVIPIIMHHHEKYDGSGYPSRLKKDKIPQGARVMAVADAFEAMVYGRPYRERMNFAAAIKEIKKKSGTQFDPRVVEAFLRAIKKIKTKKYLK